MATTQQLISALMAKGYNATDAANAARSGNAGNLAKEYLGQSVTPDVPASTVPAGAVSNAPLPTAPAGGFQQGGWYNGRQYWDGTFSEPGQINKLSTQVGAGTMVSPEVLAATSVAAGNAPGANQAYINSQYTNPSGGVGTSGVGAGTGATGAVSTPSDSQKAYDALMASMNTKRMEADKRRSEVNENPFLSEASRVGRIAKIDSMLNDSLATDQIQLTALEKKVAAEAEAAKPDLMITTESDSSGNVSIISVDKKTGKLVGVQSAGKLGKTATTSDTKTAKAALATINQLINSNANSWGHVDPVTFSDMRDAFVAEGLGTRDDFNKKYANMTDPYRTDFNVSYGFDKELRNKWTTGATTAQDEFTAALEKRLSQ